MKLFRILAFLLILNLFVLSGFLVSRYTGEVVVEGDKIEQANITNVVDGDTIDVQMGNITERVRLLGINTPEKKQYYYQEAKDFLQDFENRTVRLERTIEDKDKYGRMLRYVFYGEMFINKEILERGLAHFYTYEEDKYTEELRKAEEKARNLRLGIWEKSKEECGECIFLVELNEVDPGEYLELGNNCSFDCNLEGWRVDDDSSSHTRKLDFILPPFSKTRLDYNGSIWNDAGDSLYLRDAEGRLALFYRY